MTSSHQREGKDYLHVDTLDIDLNIKTVRMLVKKVFNNNRILSKYCAVQPAQSTLPFVTIASSDNKDDFADLHPFAENGECVSFQASPQESGHAGTPVPLAN
jgi:hypothetical protein